MPKNHRLSDFLLDKARNVHRIETAFDFMPMEKKMPHTMQRRLSFEESVERMNVFPSMEIEMEELGEAEFFKVIELRAVFSQVLEEPVFMI